MVDALMDHFIVMVPNKGSKNPNSRCQSRRLARGPATTFPIWYGPRLAAAASVRARATVTSYRRRLRFSGAAAVHNAHAYREAVSEYYVAWLRKYGFLRGIAGMAEYQFAGRLLMSGVPCRSRAVDAEGDAELLRFGAGNRVESENNSIVGVHTERRGRAAVR
jgi:hypothetical protein